ncbi:SDR family NAD(P)-dependent oxidoreductase [Rhodohalobacter sulfatireducens]|uniref:SDR family NAD(P)-dependent oxidoreductase n=1 Tax=Rhodohalobacter sulfatireducens TaxID=2911366 RepID=A0ABS9K8U8_9BACT|nr:SDR family NAD(P)-dependent oxidoreductase [Rhodohalobacter sulfatireducens]MCG2587271.1 SDR family NAD(P)-dependent oxidoreductase [Rhodohalobacter sulfatireducens]
MARIFITGSSAGLGQLAAKSLISQGHRVLLHARNQNRKQDTLESVQDAEDVLIGDLSSIEETKHLAEKVMALGTFDAIIHNAGVYRTDQEKILTVNTLAPYILTCLIEKPKRLIYLSSGSHKHGSPSLERIKSGKGVSYSDSKFHDLMLAKAVARKWPDVYSNAVDPGWVPTKMGGRGAPDDLDKGYETQVWLAVSDDEKAKVSGRYFYHKKEANYQSKADDTELQDKFMDVCEHATGVHFPE